MALKLITPSTVEVVPLALAKSHFRVDHSDDDAIIQTYIKAAIAHIEGYSGIGNVTLGQASWEQYHDAFPCDALKLLQRPVISIDKVEYLDETTGLYVLWPSSNYSTDVVSFHGWVAPIDSWPIPREAINAVKITFKAGFGNTTESIPDDLRVAVLLLAGHWYQNRESVGSANELVELPFTVRSLIGKYREIIV
jgi:uncharacterized phiE125 gp8 family phage protein